MAKVLVLADSGFGKTFSIGCIPELKHIGLNPKETYIISTTSKDLTFPNGTKDYKVCTNNDPTTGNRFVSNNPEDINKALITLKTSPFKNIVLDDFNFTMQDYYMENALKQGWDFPKKIGYLIGKVFATIETYKELTDKYIFLLAHSEAVLQPDGRIYYKLKTTGKMVDEYCKIEGKYDVVLIGKSRWDATDKKVVREYVTGEDEFIASAKSPYGWFNALYIPNDLGYVLDKIQKAKNG